MQRHDACGRGKGCKAWTPTACGGVLLFVRRPPVGGCGSPPRGLRYLREEGRESGGAVGARRAHWGGGGAVGWWVGARARGTGVR